MKPIIKSILYSASLLLALLLVGCEKNLKMDLPTNEKPQLTIYGFLYADRPTYLMLSKSVTITDSPRKEAMIIDEATVTYYINGELKETQKVDRAQNLSTFTNEDIHYIKSNHRELSHNHLYFKSQVKPKPGDKVKIEVESPNLPTASFEGTLPPAPEISGAKVERIKGSSVTLFGLDSYADNLKYSFHWGSQNYGPDPEKLYQPSLFEFVESDAYQKVTFSIKITDSDQFFSVGVPVKSNIPWYSSEMVIKSWDEVWPRIVDDQIYLVEQLLDVDNCVHFSKKARAIAKQKKDPRRKGAQYFMPYFSSRGHQVGEIIEVEVLLPLMKKRDYPSQIDSNRNLAILALSSEFAFFAEKGYGLLIGNEGGDSITDIELGEISAEHSIARRNVTNGNGVIYLASPYLIPLK